MTQTLEANARDAARDVAITRRLATVAGLIGFVLSVLTPLLPVVQTTATLNWPQNGRLGNVTAADLRGAGVAYRDGAVRGDPVHAAEGRPGAGAGTGERQTGEPEFAVRQRHQPAGGHHRQRGDRQRAAGAGGRQRKCPRLFANRDQLDDGGNIRDVRGADRSGHRQSSAVASRPNLRPAIVGVFTDLTGPAPPGLTFSATIDTRFSTKPTALKLAAMLLAIAATAVAWRRCGGWTGSTAGGCTA
jgi:arabinosyltransferase B